MPTVKRSKTPGPPEAKQLGLRARLAAAEEEVRELRARAALTDPTTVETWAINAPQDMRDRMAARALIAEWLDEIRALKRLGFSNVLDSRGHVTKEAKALAVQIFRTPGVQAWLEQQMTDIEAQKKQILARQVEIALHGDDDVSVKATAQIAKVAGWNKADAGAPASGTVNVLLQLMGSQQPAIVSNGSNAIAKNVTPESLEVIDASEFMAHTPGEAALIDDNESPKRLTSGVTSE